MYLLYLGQYIFMFDYFSIKYNYLICEHNIKKRLIIIYQNNHFYYNREGLM